MKDGIPIVSHLPFVLERPIAPSSNSPAASSAALSSPSSSAYLESHLSRANPLYPLLLSAAQDRREVLIIFHGPHGYLSPQFYLPIFESVPTWDYANVHVYAVPEMEIEETHDSTAVAPSISSDPRSKPEPHATPTLSSLDKLVLVNETKYMQGFTPNDGVSPPGLWSTSQLPAGPLAMKRRFIVGFKLRITRLDGKFKLSQNKDDAVVEQVIRGLHATKQTGRYGYL